MSVEEMVPSVRQALGVESSYDTDTIAPGIRRSIGFLLKTYRFPNALVRDTSLPALSLGAKEINLPNTGLGIGELQALVMVDPDDATLRYRLRRDMPGNEISNTSEPTAYWREAGKLILNTGTLKANWKPELLYYNSDITTAEAWITVDFLDELFNLTMFRLASQLRKAELAQLFSAYWAENKQQLAAYINEQNYSDLDIRMGERPPKGGIPIDRYGPIGN